MKFLDYVLIFIISMLFISLGWIGNEYYRNEKKNVFLVIKSAVQIKSCFSSQLTFDSFKEVIMELFPSILELEIIQIYSEC